MPRSLALVSLMTLVAAVAAAAVEGSFDRTLPVSGRAELEVRTGSGRIEVRGGSAGAVRIHGVIRARRDREWLGFDRSVEQEVRRLESNPPIEQDGVIIRVGRLDQDEWQRLVEISYEIVVPTGSRVRAESGSGSLSIDSLGGPVDAHTGAGSVTITNAQGEVRAHSGSGRVSVTGHKGSLRARTGSGRITVDGEPMEGWSLHTGSGGVDVRVPSHASFDLRAHTGSGHISVDHPVTVQGSIGRRSMSGRVRQGGPLLDISTGSGSIRID